MKAEELKTVLAKVPFGQVAKFKLTTKRGLSSMFYMAKQGHFVTSHNDSAKTNMYRYATKTGLKGQVLCLANHVEFVEYIPSDIKVLN